MYVCMYHTYVCITYCVLAAVFASWFCVLFKFWFVREATQGPPLIRMYVCMYIRIYVYIYL